MNASSVSLPISANLSGSNFEAACGRLFQGLGIPVVPMGPLKHVEAPDGIMVYTNVTTHTATAAFATRSDFMIVAQPGHFNPASFPGHPVDQPVVQLIEVRQQMSGGSVEDKLLAAVIRLQSADCTANNLVLTHTALVINGPGVSRRVWEQLNQCYGPGLMSCNGRGGTVLVRANPEREALTTSEMFSTFLGHAFWPKGCGPRGEPGHLTQIYARPVR